MSEKDEMDKVLNRAKKDADKFFSGFPYANMNRAVFRKLEKENKFVLKGRYMNYGLIAKFSALAACFILVTSGVLYFKNNASFGDEKQASMGNPVSQQMIKLDNEGMYQWLHFFRINKPDQIDSNLLAVIWRTGKSGDYEMVYSSWFEKSSKPCPAAMIAFPDDEPSMVIISSKNDDNKYMHYRVLGYKEDKILPYMEHNYVIGGELEVVGGVLKETRLVPSIYVEKEGSNDLSPIVTYYILYQSNQYGDVIPSADNLKINKGEHIAIIGDENNPIEAINPELLSNWEMGSRLTGINDNASFLYAADPGREEIYIKPLNGGESRKISVEVVEDEAGKAVAEP